MSEHQFYDSLVEFAAQNPLRLHMPGHKGKKLPMEEWNALAPLDFTELPPTGDLYGSDDWLEEAQRLWAWDWGFDAAFFSTGGSTQGIFTLFGLFVKPGDTILCDRVSHKSIHQAMALYDVDPVWLHRDWLEDCAVAGPVRPEEVEALLEEHPEATCVLLTTPTYYGVVTHLEEIARVCHDRGVKLLVDGAHGAHLPLVLDGEDNCPLGYNPFACADGVTISTHKTLPAPGQTAVVFANGVRLAQLKRAGGITGSSSPSYPMLAALDKLRAWMWENKGSYRKCAAVCGDLRMSYPSLPYEDTDPCRLVLQVEDGYDLAVRLEEMGIYVEMADKYHIVAILTGLDDEKDFLRLKRALNLFGLKGAKPFVPDLEAPPIPRRACSIRQARFGENERTPMSRSAGKVCAETVAPYPPGVPVVTMGEVLDEKTLAYLRKLCYDDASVVLTAVE